MAASEARAQPSQRGRKRRADVHEEQVRAATVVRRATSPAMLRETGPGVRRVAQARGAATAASVVLSAGMRRKLPVPTGSAGFAAEACYEASVGGS